MKFQTEYNESDIPTMPIKVNSVIVCNFCEAQIRNIFQGFPECICKACIKCAKSKRLRTASKCPNCEQKWEFFPETLRENIDIWKSTRREMGLEKCKYTKCPQFMIPENIRAHERKCKYRMEECPWCSKVIGQHNLEEHKLICHMRSPPKSQHLEKDEEFSCPFADCIYITKTKDEFSAHIIQNHTKLFLRNSKVKFGILILGLFAVAFIILLLLFIT